MVRRFLCAVLCAALFVSLAVPVSAEDDGYDELRAQIIDAMYTGERLDISEYQLSREEMLEIYEDLFHRGLLPWYADSFCDWTNAPDGTITVIVLRDLRKRSFSEDSYERAMAELIAETCHEGMTDLQKVLSVHDYIVSHAEYRYFDSMNNGYHALVRGETQCYGYSQLFLRVMDRIGIPCEIVICDDVGNGSGHAWNAVQLEGEWYHLDLTWDDPLQDAPGRALHTYFLKTDMEFKWEYGHDFGWKTEINCDDKTYSSDSIWDNITSPIIFIDAEMMLLRRNDDTSTYIYAVDAKNGKQTLLYSMERNGFWIDGNLYDARSASLCWWNERIWFNTVDAVYSLKLDGTDVQKEYTYDTAGNGKYILGCLVDDGVLNLTFAGLEDDVVDRQVELTDAQYHKHDYESAYVSATCEEGGYTQKICSCGISYQIDKSDPKGHELTEKTVGGVIRYSCLNCGYTYEEPAPATEPVPTEPPAAVQTEKAPTFLLPIAALIAAVILIVIIFLRRKKARDEQTA